MRLTAGTRRGWLHQALRNYNHDARASLEYVESIQHTLPTISQALFHRGVLQHVNPNCRTEGGKAILTSLLNECSSAAEKQEMVVGFTLLVNRFRTGLDCCEKCLYAKVRCICRDIRPVRPRHELCLLQHIGEYGRGNNTGSLLCVVAGAGRTIRGIREQEERLIRKLERAGEKAAVLFPSRDAVSVEEWKRQVGGHMGEGGGTFVLLDGTSRQAKNFDKFMPRWLTRVRLNDEGGGSWIEAIRRQTEIRRVCTAQAAAMVLGELGDTEASECIEDAVRKVLAIAQLRRKMAGSANCDEPSMSMV